MCIRDRFSSINRINPLLKIGLPFSRIWNRITTATYRVVISSSFFIIFLLTIRYFPKLKKISLSFKSKNLFRKMWFVLRGVLMGTSIVLGVVSALIIVRLLQYVQRYRTEMEIWKQKRTHEWQTLYQKVLIAHVNPENSSKFLQYVPACKSRFSRLKLLRNLAASHDKTLHLEHNQTGHVT